MATKKRIPLTNRQLSAFFRGMSDKELASYRWEATKEISRRHYKERHPESLAELDKTLKNLKKAGA